MATLLRRMERATWRLQGTLPWQVPRVPGFSETRFCIMTNHQQGENPRGKGKHNVCIQIIVVSAVRRITR